ncbi:MAG: hypothetical protein SFV15_19910 [Polyangiaceae bacterium]|nr:hypothetical protein [Polyangiaceae bacterium]
MSPSTLITRLLSVLLLSALAILPAACAGQSGPKTATVAPGPMPEGGDWTGVYYSTTYGNLHLIAEGDNASGAWRTTAGDKWGELHGRIEGNLLRYEWTEHTIGMIGPSATRKGKGYFQYLEIKKGEAHELRGQWGLDEDEAGSTWDAVKQRNLVPNLKEVRPDEIESRTSAGGWDDGSGTPGGGEGDDEKSEDSGDSTTDSE